MSRLPLEKLTALLVEAGHISQEQHRQLVTMWQDRVAKAGAQKKLDPIGFLIGINIPDRANPEGVVSDVVIARVLAKKAGLQPVKIDPLKLDMEFVHKTVSRPFATRSPRGAGPFAPEADAIGPRSALPRRRSSSSPSRPS